MTKRVLGVLLSLCLLLCLLPVGALRAAPAPLAGTEESEQEPPETEETEPPETEGIGPLEIEETEPLGPAPSSVEDGLPAEELPVSSAEDGLPAEELPASNAENGLSEGPPEAAYVFNGALAYGSLADAVAKVDPQGDVIVLRDVETDTGLNITKSMRIYSNGDNQYKITYTSEAKDAPPLLTVDTTGQVLLADIILDGGREEGREAHTELVKVYRGQVSLAAGAVIQNNDNVDTHYQENSGGVWLINGVVAMGPDSVIRGCRGLTGGGVGVATQNAQFGLLGGIIEDCEASRGGGIYVKGNGRLFLQDGSFLCNNRARKEFNGVTYETVHQAGCGGGVYVDVGLMVLITSGPKVTGCSVTGNIAEGHGGGIYLNSAVAQLTQGSVTGNRAEGYGGGILATPEGEIMFASGGTVTVANNTSGNGYFCNIYLDGSPDGVEADYPGYRPTQPITIKAALPDAASIGVSRWIRPDKDHPYRIVAVPYKGYTITDSDLAKFHSDDPNYILLLKDGNIVLTTAKVVFNNQNHGPEVPGQELSGDRLVDEPDETKMKALGYEFEGWYEEPECETPWDFTNEITEDTDDEGPILTLYAKWNLLHYEIVYELGGGENAESNPGEYTVESDPIFLEEPTREGYRFTGWKLVAFDDDAVLGKTPARSSRALPNIPAGSTGQRTFEAQWEELPKYTVTYKDGVGGAAFADQVIENVHEGTDTPAFDGTPTREGYTFKGWSPEVADKVTDDAIYIAQWEEIPTCTVTYQDGVGGAVFKPQVTEARKGDATPAFDGGTPTREGYTFKGWSPEVAAKVTGDAVYTAQWEELPKPPDPPGPGGGGGGGGGSDDDDPPVKPDPDPGTDPVPDPGTEPTPDPGTEPTPDPGTDPAPDPGTDPVPDPGTDPVPDPGTDPAPDPGTEPAPDPGTDPTPDPGTDPAPKPDPIPKTGDPTHTALWAGCALAALAGIVLALRPHRRRR